MAIRLLEPSKPSLCHGVEAPGDLNGRSSCVSGASAPLPWYLSGGMRRLGAGFYSGFTGKSGSDRRSYDATKRGRDLRQWESPQETADNEWAHLDLQQPLGD